MSATRSEIEETADALVEAALAVADDDIVLRGASLAGLQMRLTPMLDDMDLAAVVGALSIAAREPDLVDFTGTRDRLLDFVERYQASLTPRDRLRPVEN